MKTFEKFADQTITNPQHIKGGCWPKQWKISSNNAQDNDTPTEEIVFVVEDLQIA